MENNFISHSGKIQAIDESYVEVMIIAQSACAACKSKKVCFVSEMKEKVIKVRHHNQSFIVGEEVKVVMKEKTGIYAVIFAYVLPFIIMISILIAGYYSKMKELFMGLLVISFLALYFSLIYLFRKQFDKKMSFRIEKI